jgi:hypothetical protein
MKHEDRRSHEGFINTYLCNAFTGIYHATLSEGSSRAKEGHFVGAILPDLDQALRISPSGKFRVILG